MTSWVVADSSSLIATALQETYSEHASQLWEMWDNNQIQVAAPTLFRYEIVSVIRKHVNRGNLLPSDGLLIRDTLLAKQVHLFLTDDLLKRAYEIAEQFNRPAAYDSQYLAVAENLGCEFWTNDERLFNVVGTTLPWVKWIGNFTLSK